MRFMPVFCSSCTAREMQPRVTRSLRRSGSAKSETRSRTRRRLAIVAPALLVMSLAVLRGTRGEEQDEARPSDSKYSMTFELRADGPNVKSQVVKVLKDREVLVDSELPERINFYARMKGPHDGAAMHAQASEGRTYGWSGWGPEKLPEGLVNDIAHPLEAPAQASSPLPGWYKIRGRAYLKDKLVDEQTILVKIVHKPNPPRNTKYLYGKKDHAGTPITCSTPVELGPLNEGTKLRDNDYPFEPQKALDVINFERFPPFDSNPKFLVVWNSRRFTDEPKFGGPMDRGFNCTATENKGVDHLVRCQRVHFDTADLPVEVTKDLCAKDKDKYHDLAVWAEKRSAWVSPENAQELGKICFEKNISIYSGIGYYSFDEEQMCYEAALRVFKENPEVLPTI